MHSRQFYCIADSFIAQQKALLQKALLHSKQLQCTAERFIAQQESLLHNKKFCCIAEKLVMQQKLEKSSFCGKKLEKSLFCGRNWRKVPSTAETEDKHHILPTVSMLLANETQFAHKLGQIKLQLDRSQLSYSEYQGPIPQEVARPNSTKKMPTTIIK